MAIMPIRVIYGAIPDRKAGFSKRDKFERRHTIFPYSTVEFTLISGLSPPI